MHLNFTKSFSVFALLVFLNLVGSTSLKAQRLEKRLDYIEEMVNKAEYNEALIYINRIIRKDDGIARAFYLKSVCLLYTQKPEPALESIKRAVYLEEQNADYWAMNGTILHYLNKPQLAVSRWQSALLHDSTNLQANLGLADHFLARDSFSNALHLLRKLQPALHNNADWQYRMGYAHQGMGQFEKAAMHYNACIERNPVDETAHYHLALCYFAQKEWDSCATLVKTLVRLNPKEAEYYYLLGKSYKAQGKKEQALMAYEKAVKLAPENMEYQRAVELLNTD